MTDDFDSPVLVVEDNESMRKLVTTQLKKLGYPADVATNGKEALDKLSAATYSLVLMDVQMPIMDGLEATKAVRDKERETGEHAVIIALTGHCSRTDCLAAGMDDFIAKPMNIATLKKVMERWLPQSNVSV
ncbi:MAG TPA: response regulator [Trichormus sp.]|jgi:polar amino acid transport system substrate-binding protein